MAIGYEATEWKDGAQGGTPIDAAALNKMENGISEACAAVDLLNEEGNVTTGDIASKAVTTEKIADGAVGLDQLSEEVRDSVSQLSEPISGFDRVEIIYSTDITGVPIQHSAVMLVGVEGTAATLQAIDVVHSGSSNTMQVSQVVISFDGTSGATLLSERYFNVLESGTSVRLMSATERHISVHRIAGIGRAGSAS